MKEDIIAANISGLRSDIQSLTKQIAAWSQSLAQQATPAPQTQIDEQQLLTLSIPTLRVGYRMTKNL